MNSKIEYQSLLLVVLAIPSFVGLGYSADKVTGGTPNNYVPVPNVNVLQKQHQDDQNLVNEGKFDQTAILRDNVHGAKVSGNDRPGDTVVASDKSGKSSPQTTDTTVTQSTACWPTPCATDGAKSNDRGYAACSIGAPGVEGNCHYYELYANWIFGNKLPTATNPPLGKIIEDFGYEDTPGVYITYSSPTQVNIAVAPNAKFVFDGYKYISSPSNTGGTWWTGHGFDAFVLPY